MGSCAKTGGWGALLLPFIAGCGLHAVVADVTPPVAQSTPSVRASSAPPARTAKPLLTGEESSETAAGPPVAGQASDGALTLPLARPGTAGDTAPQTYTLDRAINECLLADPKLRAGIEAISQANADALTASLCPNPTLTTDVQMLPLTRAFTVDRQGGPPQLTFQLGYRLDWFLFGKRAATMASANLGTRVSEAEYQELARNRIRDVAMAFYDVLESKELLVLSRQDVQSYEKVEAITVKAVEAGTLPRLELARVRLDLQRSRQALREAEGAMVTAKARLLVLLGRTEAGAAFDVAGVLTAPRLVEPLSVEAAFALALEQRPDLQSLRLKTAQAQANIELERRKAYPEITPTFGYTRQYQVKAIGFPDANSWGLNVEMKLPCFDRNQGNQAKAVAQLAQRHHELRAGEVALRAEIATALQELATAHTNALAVSREQLQLAAEVRDTVSKAYQEAKMSSLLDLLDAQRTYRETSRLAITSQATYWRALYRLSAAVGKQVQPHD